MRSTNTALAEALRHAHLALGEDLRKLEAALAPASRKGLAELRAWLTATKVHITEHFRFEEENGYMDAVRQREPRLERNIQHIADEHRQLAEALDALIKASRTAASVEDGLCQEVRAWIEHIRQHEARENELIQNAFNLDIGMDD